MAIRAVIHFLFQLAVAFAISMALAVIWALAASHSFEFTLHISAILIGVLTILLGFIGFFGPSAADTFLTPWSSIRTPPGATSVNANAILILTGAALIVVGTILQPSNGP